MAAGFFFQNILKDPSLEGGGVGRGCEGWAKVSGEGAFWRSFVLDCFVERANGIERGC